MSQFVKLSRSTVEKYLSCPRCCVLDKATPVLIIKGCPKGIKDKIAPIKAVRFFISK